MNHNEILARLILAEMGTDATKWAEEFASRVDLTRGFLDPSPGELLHVWFCNAIETGRTAGMAEEARTGNYRKSMEAALGPNWSED